MGKRASITFENLMMLLMFLRILSILFKLLEVMFQKRKVHSSEEPRGTGCERHRQNQYQYSMWVRPLNARCMLREQPVVTNRHLVQDRIKALSRRCCEDYPYGQFSAPCNNQRSRGPSRYHAHTHTRTHMQRIQKGPLSGQSRGTAIF